MDEQRQRVTELISHSDRLFANQTNWRHTWQDLSDYIYPVKSNIETLETPGEVRATERYDTTAEEAMLDAAAGLVGWLCPIGEQWFKFEPQLNTASEDVKRWYRECSKITADALFTSNFYLTFFEGCIDAMLFGTWATFAEQSPNELLNYVSWPIGTYTFTVNSEGKPDQVYRRWKWTARQAVQEWGEDKVGKDIRKCYLQGGKDAEREFEFEHCIKPRAKGEYVNGPTSGEKRPIASIYYCRSHPHLIEESGFYEMPVAIGRTLKSNSEQYGRSPGMGVLPEIKMLNKMEHDIVLALEKMVSPPWLMRDDSEYVPDNRPNGITYYRDENSRPEQQEFTNRIDLGEQKTEQKRERIRKAFFNDMFQMVTALRENRQPPTALQIQEMVNERIVLFTPIFARTIQEVLNPLLERTFGLLYRARQFPEPPPDVIDSGGAYEITYVSRIAMALKSLQNNQLMQGMNLIMQMMEINPQARFLLNWKKAGLGGLENTSLPNDWINTQEEIDQMIEAENQQVAMAQALEGAQVGADALGKLPEGVMKGMR